MTIEDLHSLQAAHDRVAALERQHVEDLRRLSAMEENIRAIWAEIDSLRWRVARRENALTAPALEGSDAPAKNT